MNIVSAIRDLPDPPFAAGGRRRWVATIALIALGALMAVSGISAKNAITLGLGVSLLIFGLDRLLRALGLNERAVRTGAGLALMAWFVLPISDWLFGPMKVNFSIFVLGGLMIVIGATWTIMYNADVLLGALGATLGRVKRIAPVVRMSIAYPLRSLFRTGVTLAMFMLVVFVARRRRDHHRRVHQRLQRHQHLRRRLRRARDRLRSSAGARHAGRGPPLPGAVAR